MTHELNTGVVRSDADRPGSKGPILDVSFWAELKGGSSRWGDVKCRKAKKQKNIYI